MANGEYALNGERRLQEYDKQAQKYFDLAKISEQQITDYTTKISDISEQSTKFFTLFGPPGVQFPFPTPEKKRYAEFAEKAITWSLGIKNNMIGATDELEKNLYYYNIYSVVPATVVTGSASSLDEVLEMYPMPGSLSEAERTTIKETITDMLSHGATPPEDFLAQAAAELELPPLVAPTPVSPFVPVGLHQLSTDEIVKALTMERLPSPVMSQEDWAELLKGMGYSDADLEATEYNRAEAERLALEWQEQANMLESFKSGLTGMPDYKLADMLKEMATQPGLALLDTSRFYFEHTSQPLAGALYKNFIPDIEAEYQRLKKTESTREALSRAWMNWEFNWFLKYVIMEGLVDPLTYVGWGIATKLTKPIPHVGRFVGAAERGAQELFEMPFDMLKVGWRRLPKTAAQRALIQQHTAGQTLRKFLERYTGKHLIQLSMSEVDDTAAAAAKFALAHPQSDDLAALAGRELLKHTPVSPDDVASWTTRLGTSLGPDDVTRVTIENTENIFEDYFMRSMITEKEAAARLLKVLSVTDTSDAKLKVAQRLLQDRGNRIKAGVTAFAKAETPFDAMQAIMRRNYKMAIKIEDSAAYLSRMNAGRATVLLHGVEVKAQAIWKNYIDRLVVRPFAEAYLTFGMYGPMNVLEDYLRSSLGGVIPRRMNVETWQRLSWGLSVDDDLSRYGLSEMTGYLAREGAEDTWNNWVLQLAAGGQKKWANKAYTVMVRRPGAYGMDVRRNFIGRRYEQLFREQGGDVVEALLKAGPNTPKLSGKLVKQLEAEVYRMKTTLQPDNIRSLKSVFTHKKLTRAEVQNAMSQYPDMPPAARQHIIKAYDSGELFKDIDGTMKVASDILVDDFVRSPEYATAQIHALTKELMALEVTNPQEMAETIRMVQIMCDSYDALPHQVVAQATVRSRGLPLAQRKDAFNRDFDLLYKFIDDAGVDIESAIAKVRNAIPRLAPNDDYVTRSNRLLDIMASRKEYAADFRAQNMALRREIFESISPKERTGKFWQDFYEQMDTDWGVFEIKDAELFGLQVQAVESLDLVSGIKPFSRPVLSITDRALSPQDIASLIGCRGDDISKALLEVMAVNSKPRFTAYVMAKVRPGDAGFTKEAVGAVYDQIVGSLYIKPETFSYITRCKMQTEGLRKELWALHNSKMYPDDELKQIYKYLDDTADAVDKLAYKAPVAAPVTVSKPLISDTYTAKQVGQSLADVSNVATGKDWAPTLTDAVKRWAKHPEDDTLQLIGKTASGSKSYQGEVLKVLKERYPGGYIRVYRGHGQAGSSIQALKREFLNVTSDKKMATKFGSTKWLTPEGSVNSIVIRIEDVVAIGAAGESELIVKSTILKSRISSPLTKLIEGAPTRALKPEFTKLDDVRQSAMDEAHKWYYKEYPDYTNANAFDAMMKSIFPYWCVPEYATALTRNGWKHYSELHVGEDLLTVNPETLVTEWQPLQNIAVFDYDDELMVIPAKGKDIEFTPNHRWLIVNEWSDKPKIKRGYELKEVSDLIPRALPHKFPEDSILSPRDAAILGWVVTDGYYQRRNNILTALIIYQSEKKYLDEIVALTGGSAYPRSSESTDWIIRVKLEDRDRISSVCCCSEDVIDLVPQLSKEAAEAMWDAMFKAEGNSDNGWLRFKQNPGSVKEAFEMLSVLLGKGITSGYNTVYMTNNHKPYQAKQVRRMTTKHYTGKVWCPVTPSGTWFMNCNGSIVPTGNTYESQRWFWLPRSFVRHPGTFTAFERWQNNTDYGYIHIPNTSVDTNPFRGTIYGTLTTRLTRRDFPEYYDAYPPAGELVEFMDFISRFGFYPGVHISAPLAALGGMEAQLGETMPAVWKTPLMAAIAMFPESESVKFISERVFGDRFRDYVTILMVNKRGGNGSLLWTKMKEGVELTPEEQQSWTDSRREAAKYGVGMEQFGLFRLRTDEQYKVYEEASKVIEDMTGFTPEQQKWLRMHGYRVWDMVGGLSFTQQAILQEMDYYRWVGMITPLLPSRQQGEYRKIELFWDDVKNFTEKQYQGKLDLQRDLVGGIIGPDEYGNRVREIYSTQRSYIDELKTSNLYKGVPVTFEERKEMLEKHGKVVPVLHPSKELLNLYFEIELTQKIDEETGEKVWDWDSFWAMREAVEAAVPEEYKQEWDDYLIRNTTPLEQIRRQVSQEYFRSYNRVWEQVLLTQYSETEQHLIKEWYSLRRRGISLDRQADISATVRDNGKQLISNFQSDVSEARKALRYANPLLDAWLYYWGRTTSFLTPEANEAYPQICSETARQI